MIFDLTGSWAVREVACADLLLEATGEGQWLEASVPGCIHLDLMKAGRIPDPFYGFNDLEVQWVAERNWLYRRSFDCPSELAAMARVELVCEGLDTFAQVFLNGTPLGRGDNMFRQWRWDATGCLKAKGNELLVLFESPSRTALALSEADGSLPQTGFGPGRSYVRKAQYASGWDWGPALNTSGIWKPTYLEGHEVGRLSDVWARVLWDDPQRPVVQVSIEIESLCSAQATVDARLTLEKAELTASARAPLAVGRNAIELSIPVEKPQLWWPAGSGQQPLYRLAVTAKADGRDLGAGALNLGLRRVELRRDRDEEGESFVIHVNGQPLFCKGANWIPADSFLPRVTRQGYERLLTQARDANMNMLRVWGGGIYEADEFFDACDRLGIMVWADFMFACAGYPDHLDWFRRSVEAEAECNVRRLRNHPSLVLWCGNNECQWLYPQLPGSKLYDEVLSAVCARLDPDRPYWPGSPYGGPEPNSPTHGDQHFWDPWGRWQSPEALRHCRGRFVSEFGFQAPPALETIRKYIPSSGHHMQSRAMEHHNRAPEGTQRLFRYLSGFFRVPCDFEDAVYLMQLAQGEAVKMGVEFWRSRKLLTAGALFWQLNDCWPVTSWSCLDYEGRPKALYYYARRFYAPLLPVIDFRDGRFAVTVVNDSPSDFQGRIVCGFGHVSGDQKWVQQDAVSVPANSLAVVRTKDASELPPAEPEEHYFWCRLLKDRQEVAKNAWFLLPYKHVEFEPPEWEVNVHQAGPCAFGVDLRCSTFAKGVWLRVHGVEAQFSDNFLDVFAEVPARVEIRTAEPLEPEELRRRLRIRSVAEAQAAGATRA